MAIDFTLVAVDSVAGTMTVTFTFGPTGKRTTVTNHKLADWDLDRPFNQVKKDLLDYIRDYRKGFDNEEDKKARRTPHTTVTAAIGVPDNGPD